MNIPQIIYFPKFMENLCGPRHAHCLSNYIEAYALLEISVLNFH